MNRRFRGSNVILNVYDLSPANSVAYEFGVGAFHSGIVVGGTEYTFGGHEGSSSGVFTHSPKQAPGAEFRIAIDMGETTLSSQDVQREVSALGEFFPGNAYHLVLKNCNHFSNELCLRLTGKPIPGWVNRLAYMGSWFSCLLPKSLGVAHPDSMGVKSQSALDSYRRSGVRSFQAFTGEGQTLAPSQEMMQTSSSRSAGAAPADDSERRALLAAAALRRFENKGSD